MFTITKANNPQNSANVSNNALAGETAGDCSGDEADEFAISMSR